jgi:Flp pilus assembly protein TadG
MNKNLSMPYRRQRGISLLYTIVILLVMLGFASFGVDVGRVQLAKTEARRAADSAAHAAASALYSSVSAAQNAAVEYAGSNEVDGQPVTLNLAEDVEFGLWDSATREFTVLTGDARPHANAVRVNVRRTAARGNPIPMVFAKLIGMSTCDVRASAIAANQTRRMLQLVGLDDVKVQNNFFGGTYSSLERTTPTHETAGNGASVASNTSIWAKMNEKISTAIIGPEGESNLDLESDPYQLPTDISVPMPTWTTAGNDMTVATNKTLSGGTHYIRDLTIKHGSTLSFSGPATVYISGTVTLDGDVTIKPISGIPSDLKIYQQGNGSFGEDKANNVELIGDIWAPNADFSAKNNALLIGRMLWKSILVKNNLDYYYDTQLAPPFYTSKQASIQIVK